MTFATEAAKFGNQPLFVLEFTSGSTTHRYAPVDVAITGVGFVEGRIVSFGGAARSAGIACDNTGPDIAVIDEDGSVENSGITNGWTVTVKVGFLALAWADWLTFATYRVYGRPSRMSRILYFKTCGPGVFTLGRLSMPKIEADDTYLFTTLRVAADRVGEPLPYRFGSHGREGGAVELLYLGINPSASTLVWLVSAADLSSAPLATAQIGDVFVDGVKLELLTFTSAVVATGNYHYLIVSLSIDQAARLGILDDKTYRTYRLATHHQRVQRGMGRHDRAGSGAPSSVEVAAGSISGARPVRTLTANFVGPFGGPVTLIQELLAEHGSGLGSRSESHYTALATYVSQYALTICGEIRGDIELRTLVDAICAELGIDQFYTSAGLHALLWPFNVSADDAGDALAGCDLYDDLHMLVGEPSWHHLDGGDKAQATAVDLTTPFGSEEIVDTAAVTAYGTFRVAMNRQYSICKALSSAIAWHRIQARKEPRTVMRASTSLAILARDPGLMLRVSAHGGPALAGWTNQPCRLQRVSLDASGSVAGIDVEDRGPIESALSTYMKPLSTWVVDTIDVTWTAAGRGGSTADAGAADLRVGDIAYYQEAAGTDRQLWARVQKVVENAGTYHIYVADSLENPAGAISTQFLRQSAAAIPSAGRTGDDKRCSSLIHGYLDTNSIAAFGLNEQSTMVPGDTAYTSGSTLRQLRANGTRTLSHDGQFGPVCVLDGSTAFYDDAVPYADFIVLGTLTICAWVYAVDIAAARTICSCGGPSDAGASGDNFAYWFYVNTSGQLVLFWEQGSGTNVSVNTTWASFPAASKVFVAVTRGATGICKFYVGDNDTTPALVHTSGTNTLPNDGADGIFHIGCYARGAAYKMSGWVQGLLIRDSEETLAAITTLWTNSKRESCSLLV